MVKSESFIEGTILDYVKTNNRLFGYYDFMSRQYVASPNKPAEYTILQVMKKGKSTD